MELFPKFIIEDGCLILGKVSYHHQLANDKTKVKGGGWFWYDAGNNTFVLHGDSHDFGKARLADISECVASGKVFNDKYHRRNLSGKHRFSYNTGSEVIQLSPSLPLNQP